MHEEAEGISAGPQQWQATVIGAYDFERGKPGDTCTVVAQTAFEAWHKAEPILGVAREHIALHRGGAVESSAASAPAERQPAAKGPRSRKR